MTNAFISINQICNSWLLKNGKTIHFYYKAAKLATDAVRELTLSSLPIINHKILEKNSDESWFQLPDGYTDWVSIGVLTGEYWQPVTVHNRLIPFTNSVLGSESFDDSIDIEDFTPTNWMNPASLQIVESFSDADFDSSDFATVSNLLPSNIDPVKCHCANNAVVAINAAQNLIVTPMNFPGNKLYIVYVSCGSVDTMTHIPLAAQAAIEAYMDWGYALSKRNGASEARIKKLEYQQQHKILRARLNDLTTVDIARIQDRGYDFASNGVGYGGGAMQTASPTPPSSTPSNPSAPQPAIYQNYLWVFAMGNAPATNVNSTYKVSVANGNTIVHPSLAGQVLSVRVGNQNVEPIEGEGYEHFPNSQAIIFPYLVSDINVYVQTKQITQP